MTSMKSGLVFDFPDPTPRFEFSDATSPFAASASKKGGAAKLKNSKGFGKFKSQKARGGSLGKALDAGGSASRSSPDKSTATTASESSFDESVFDDFDLQVFDFGKSKRGDAKPATHDVKHAGQPNGLAASSFGSGTHYELSAGKSSFESTSLKPLKLPVHNSPQHLHKRTQSSHSNISTGYISEVSEFSFDRVTVNTNETPMTGASSNISWNFFEETKDLLRHDDTNGIFVPYTGQDDDRQSASVHHGGNHKQAKANSITIKSLLQDPNSNNHNNNNNNSTPKHTHNNNNNHRHARRNSNNRIDIDNISLSDQSHELPISGIVGSNQSIVSEISGDNIQDEQDLNDNVKMHLHQATNATVNNKNLGENGGNESKTKSLTPPTACPKKGSHSPSSHCGGEHISKPSSSILQEFQDYKNKRIQQREIQIQGRQQKPPHDSNTRTNALENEGNETSNKRESLFQSVMGNVCIGLEFCSWYLCGTDTTQQEGEKEPTKEERQKEMDQTFLGKTIFCGCQDFDCGGMSAMM
ncbi:hypothetical protein HJC23_005763 [Cyclotella cryptica]|uniref:Uncharacterized protein n=1 Tax=Cyclotella cryptica TaxID=29204 RepID=A0ABD3NGX9_9STRA|eukprot:CCRYP_020988-RA/>CCRYP_020988-RA protein AED:0.04 eAED:0.04 QI:370/1/1/1/1/1/2/230/526